MIYRVHHVTIYSYSCPVSYCLNYVHLTPRDTWRQRCQHSHMEIIPAPLSVSERHDFFGNPTAHFAVEQTHQTLTVAVTSEVEVRSLPDLFADPEPLPWEQVRDETAAAMSSEDLEARQFLYESAFVPWDRNIAAYARASFPPRRLLVEAVSDLTRRIHADFQYDPDFSTVATPLSHVMSAHRGVCQDFAHLGVACLRSLGLAARYVSGYLETDPPPGKPKLQGSDATHAWFAVYQPRHGWLDFDPTNNQPTGERHISLGWGRDYGDVAPLRGVIVGGGAHQLRVAVDVIRRDRMAGAG
jgi:transglutaminase-like putative cysteine protease